MDPPWMRGAAMDGEPQGEVWGEDAEEGRVHEAHKAARLRGVMWEAPSPDRPDHRAPMVNYEWAGESGACGGGWGGGSALWPTDAREDDEPIPF